MNWEPLSLALARTLRIHTDRNRRWRLKLNQVTLPVGSSNGKIRDELNRKAVKDPYLLDVCQFVQLDRTLVVMDYGWLKYPVPPHIRCICVFVSEHERLRKITRQV